ncbi:MAG: DUF3784 domain-containing protein [Lachnospiraceae bacterium]|nr:DUF3784 domain-containing protein [Lachnospiraceae bacterium]MDD6618116.1 DUF3784 domain-containing protein [Clostridiales bacterium]MDY4769308.1 DUF3784 domain-containing protein [Lachnospiraceae bacterium]
MGTGIDFALTAVALIVGIMMILGKGDFFLNDKNARERNRIYDMRKVQKGFGVVLIVVGIATGVSAVIASSVAYIIYTVVVLLAFAGGIVYMRKCCKR